MSAQCGMGRRAAREDKSGSQPQQDAGNSFHTELVRACVCVCPALGLRECV